jgi:hypothetical protein
MSRLLKLNILIYTCLSSFQVLLLGNGNDFLFIYLFIYIIFDLFDYLYAKKIYLNLDFLNYRNMKNLIVIFFLENKNI